MASVLVVDDEREIAAAIEAILEDEGHQVSVCNNGREAIDLLSKGEVPDLIITDIMMPRLSGLELLVHVRQSQTLKGVPVILMSGVNPTKSRGDAAWDDFLKKPFNLDALLTAVARQIRRRAS